MVNDNCLRAPVVGIRTFVTLLCAGFLCGCGGPAAKVPDASQQATISGKVTLDGTKPAPVDTSVVFFCADKGATVSGKVDALGSYTIQAADKSIGIPAGRYQVMIRPAEKPPAQMGSDDYKKAMMGGGAKTEEPKSDIPAKFHAFDTSKIVLEIKPGANANTDLDLSKL
jgi:hypothetical protein